MKRTTIIPWEKANVNSREGKEQLVGWMQRTLDKLGSEPLTNARIQHFTTKGEFPDEVLEIIAKYVDTPMYDTAFEQIFDIRNFTGMKADGFKILNVTDGLTFDKIVTGGKAQIYSAEGSVVSVNFAQYAAAMEFDKKFLDDGQYYLLEDAFMTFRNKAQSTRAQVFYDLIDAVGSGENITWQNPDPAALANTDPRYTRSRDINTMNLAAQTILLDLKDKGMGITAGSEFIILAPIQLMGRVKQALAYTDLTLGGAATAMYNFRPLFTTMLSSSSVYYVILPKGKAKGGDRQLLTMYNDFDILSNSRVDAGWMRFGGAIGEVNQFKRCATS